MWLLPFSPSDQDFICIAKCYFACYLHCPSNISLFYRDNNMWWKIQIMRPERRKVFDQMFASITRILCALNLLVNGILIRYCCSEMFKLRHVLEWFVSHLRTMVILLSCKENGCGSVTWLTSLNDRHFFIRLKSSWRGYTLSFWLNFVPIRWFWCLSWF
jgi:hypothetical protein